MKSWLLDASADLVHSHTEGETSIYTLKLVFVDMFNRQRKHFATVEIPAQDTPTARVSFTAMSSVTMKVGIVKEVTDLKIHVFLSDRVVTVPNRKVPKFNPGESICLAEPLDPAADATACCLVDLPLTYPPPFNPESVCLQTVNADVMSSDGRTLYRLCADPFYLGA